MKFLSAEDLPKIKAKIESVRPYLSEEVFRHMRLCLFQNGETVFTEGEKADYLFIILEGSCKVFKTLENGKTLLLCCYEEIQILGEFEMFGDCTAKTSIQALKDTYCLSIPVPQYRELLLSDNQFLRFVCRQTCVKIERNNQNTGINLLYPLEQRLARYLLVMQNGGAFAGNYTLLAEYLGCSHRHLLRTLQMLCGKHILQKEGTAYHIKDFDALKELAGEIYQ